MTHNDMTTPTIPEDDDRISSLSGEGAEAFPLSM